MNPTDALEAEMPPPRDDEPPALRREIIDELADHLECSFRHELLRGQDPETARARALERFGDPGAIARRLWLDAMKGKIMRQRLLIAVGLVVVLASVAMTSLAWTAMARVQLENARAREAAQAANLAMLARLNEMVATLKNPRSPDWNPVKVVVVDETPDGPPVEGVALRLSRARSNSIEQTWQEKTDSEGKADLGLLHPGDYDLWVDRSTPEGTVTTSKSFRIKAGSEVVRRIVCPRPPRAKAAVKVVCQWPREFANEKLYLYVPFYLSSREMPSNSGDDQPDSWTLHLSLPAGSTPRRNGPMGPFVMEKAEFQAYLFGTDGSTTEFRDGRAPFPWVQTPSSGEGPFEFPIRFLVEVANADRLDFDPTRAKWTPWSYEVSVVMVLRALDSKDVAPGRRRYEVVAGVSGAFQTPIVPNNFLIRKIPPSDDEIAQPFNLITQEAASWLRFIQSPRFPFNTPNGQTRFEASLDHPTEWTITFPEELTQELRKALKKPRAMEPSPQPMIR